MIRRLGAETVEYPVTPRLRRRRRARPRPRPAARGARQRDRPRRRGGRPARVDAHPRRRSAAHPRPPGGRASRSRPCRSAGARGPDRPAAASAAQAAGHAADLHRPPVRRATRSSASSTTRSSVLDQPVVARLRVRRDQPGALVALEDGRYAVTGPLLDRRLPRRRHDLRAAPRRTAADPEQRAWLQTVVGALAIDVFDRAPVQGPRPRRPARPSEPGRRLDGERRARRHRPRARPVSRPPAQHERSIRRCSDRSRRIAGSCSARGLDTARARAP